MVLRCFLFSSDEGTAGILRHILSGLGVEAESCPTAVGAAERITNQPFQLVIIDWDQQPEAGLLLNSARERKAAERPITLAIVSHDADAPQALHAGANSLLRKPIVANQARETLTTARDLLRSKQGSSATTAMAAAAPASAPLFAALPNQGASTIRAAEFLQTPTLEPGGLVETETAIPMFSGDSGGAVAPLKELEPAASSLDEEQQTVPALAPKATGARGLDWYLKNRAAAGTSAAAPAPAPVAPTAPNPARGNPDLLGYDQTSSYPAPSAPAVPQARAMVSTPAPKPEPSLRQQKHEQRNEAELFAYIQGEKRRSSEQAPASGFRLAKRALIPAFVLAAIATVAAPQAPWHPHLQALWRSGRQRLHVWLNPQPITPPPQPAAHETFTRPGDEYKLPVAESIPDATTDPAQIQVVPVIDPTIKKTNPEGANAMDPSAIPQDGSTPAAEVPGQNPAVQIPDNQPPPANSDPFRPIGARATAITQPTVSVIESPVASHPETAASPSALLPSIPKGTQAQPHAVSSPGTIPPSLKSHIAPASPLIGSKPVDAAPAAIEPVQVSESAERSLSTDSPLPPYPANGKGQQGSVVLQVLIGRDGTVQDAKFMQGSLIFARNASEAVRQWKFKPYVLNGHAVSVQTQLTIRFKPGQ